MHPKWNIFKDKKYEKWIRTKNCLVCGARTVDCHHCWPTGRKKEFQNSYISIPLCRSHHSYGKDSYHSLGHKSFEELYNLDLKDEIINLLSEYIFENE